MKECIGKKIVDIDDRDKESPFFRILLEDGSLIHVAIDDDHQSANVATGEDARLLSHKSLSWANSILRNIGFNITRHCDDSIGLDWKLEKSSCQGLALIAVIPIADRN